MAHNLLRSLTNKVHEAGHYAVIMNETADIFVKKLVSTCFQIVQKHFNFTLLQHFKQFFLFLFFNTADTRAATLFAILKDVLCHFRLTIGDCHEQCCDGATNMRRRYRTLRGLVQQEQQLALYIRCMACMSLTWCCRARVRSGNMLRFLGRDVWKQLCYVLSEA